MSAGVVLRGLDGANPLGFLASLGALRLLSLEGEDGAAMRWVREDAWRPELVGLVEEGLAERLAGAGKKHLPLGALAQLGKNITVGRATFAAFARGAYEAAASERVIADFAAAFGSEVCEQEGKDRIEYTELCFITGSGHQDFIGTMDGLAKNVGAEHIQEALFGPWETRKGLSMRWDPGDAAEYAFRWQDPSKEGAWSVWGANLLAVHALPMLPAQPTARGLRTTGMRRGGRGQWPEFSWPMWTEAIGLDTARSLMSWPGLQAASAEMDRRRLRAFGIAEVYRSARVRIGQGANFKVSFRPAQSV